MTDANIVNNTVKQTDESNDSTESTLKKVITEGKAKMLFEEGKVFYNEVQVKNRDLSILVINEFARQLLHESNEREAKKQAKAPSWRKPALTWDTWRDRSPAPETNTNRDKYCGMFILEALAASGLRSIRYAKEIVDGVGIDQILVNDIEKEAYKAMQENGEMNGLKDDPKFKPNIGDANQVMFEHRCRDDPMAYDRTSAEDLSKRPFDVVDLDPYGSPSVFADMAVQSVNEGGLLCVTATDMPALCGKDPEACFSRYGAMPLRGIVGAPHELAIRMLLGFLERTAAKYSRCIVPILSVHFDFYVRVFVRVYSNKLAVKQSSLNSGMLYQSRGCESFYIQPIAEPKDASFPERAIRSASVHVPSKCEETGADFALAGPLWTKPTYNPVFVKRLLEYFETGFKHCPESKLDMSSLFAGNMIQGKLLAISEELRDVPLAYSLSSVCKRIASSVPMQSVMFSAISNAGYRVSRTQSDPVGFKTDAPPSVVWDIMRAWVQQHPVKMGSEKSAQQMILAKPPSIDVDFTIAPAIRQMLNNQKFANPSAKRYAPNPGQNWGPKAAAAGSGDRQTHRKKPRKTNTKEE